MSMFLNFDPHSWYMDFAIKHDPGSNSPCEWEYNAYDKTCTVHGATASPYDDYCEEHRPRWSAFVDDGNTYRIVTKYATTLSELKSKIREYHITHHDGYGERLLARKKEA